MRPILRFLVAVFLVLGHWAVPATIVSAANLDTIADRVFGQPNFTSNISNNGGISATSLYLPSGVALDTQGNLYVADYANSRVLEYDAPLTAGATADRVFGQPNFTTATINNGGLGASSLKNPTDVAVDTHGNLYIADYANHRVLEYDTPLTAGVTADRVFGQPNFTSNTANNGGVSATSLQDPAGLALDGQGNLFVADEYNHRVLEYNTPLNSDTTADHVFGQPNFTSNIPNNGGISATSLNFPKNVEMHILGDLYIADSQNNRVLEFDLPLSTDSTADLVLGQPNFNSNSANNGGINANSLASPVSLALDGQLNLYVADSGNNRVLEYNTPQTARVTADRVFGQPNFTSATPNNGGVSANSLSIPYSVALDAQGNLFVAEFDNQRVLEYDVPVPYGVPTENALSPSTVAVGSPAFILTVRGSGFVAGSRVRWNGSDRPTTFVSSNQINASISASDVKAGGPFAVTVFTPTPGGGTSTLLNLPLYLRNGQDTAADGVLGQPNFLSGLPNNAFVSGDANRLFYPGNVVVDPRSARLFVADSTNNRVLSWPNGPAFANGQAADLVIGQPDFFSKSSNHGGINAKSLYYPTGVTLDAQGNLYVVDRNNHRVLIYLFPLTNGMSASLVFGQGGSFTSALANNGGVSANSLDFPSGLELDSQGNLYITDSLNNRLLEYNTPLTAGTTADQVLGQPNFNTGIANNGGVSANSLNGPNDLALDVTGNLYIADTGNNRVLEYDSVLSTGTMADRVFGQPNFTSNTSNNGGINANSLYGPGSVALDIFGDLFVADTFNHRALEYNTPLTAGTSADRIFGQPNFTSNTFNNGGISASSLYYPSGLGVDIRGNLYIADSFNHRVLEYASPLFFVLLPYIQR